MSSLFLMLIVLGLVIGTIGTMIGAGGGFILVPLLILIFPSISPAVITAISLAIVAINASSGSIAYVKSKRIDYKAAIVFALATIPGSILGVFVTHIIPKQQFDLLFGIVLVVLSIFLYLKAGKNKVEKNDKRSSKGNIHSVLIDKEGERYDYFYNQKVGIFISVFVGFVAPILGIGGGIIHVPAMTEWLGFPVHIATATSHFILAIMTIVSVTVHFFEGSYDDPETLKMIGALAIGIIPGAIIGAKISGKVKGKIIIRLLSISLVVVGIRILIHAFQ